MLQAAASVLTFDCATMVLAHRMPKLPGGIMRMAFSPTGRHVWCLTSQRSLFCLSLATGASPAPPTSHALILVL